MRLISRVEVLNRTSISQPTLWRLENRGKFPRSIRISKNRVAYNEEEVDAWIQSRIRESRPEIEAYPAGASELETAS